MLELFPKDVRMKHLSDFVRKADSWFDVFNSHSITNKLKSHKSAYGQDLDNQNRIIEEFTAAVRSLRVGDRQSYILQVLKQYQNFLKFGKVRVSWAK